VKTYLLDINVLIALAWPSHVHHALAQRWFAAKRRSGFSTCPITQTGFVRISSNPRFIANAVTPIEALQLLDRMTALPEHLFWPDDLELSEVVRGVNMLSGHRQVTDAYLLSLASKHGGRLATLDRAAVTLARHSHLTAELLSEP